MTTAIERDEFGYVDVRLSQLLTRLGQVNNPAISRLFKRLSRALAEQHSCIDIGEDPADLALADELRHLPIVSAAGQGTPLVLDGNRLYLQRYFQYETRIAARLLAMNQPVGTAPARQCAAIIDELFDPAEAAPRQRLAVLQAMTRQLTIVTGGPGTGKTTTVARILAALIRSNPQAPPVVKLAAPTGKAAMRMKEALAGAALPVAPEVLTLHRLLGVRANGRDYRYGESKSLALDLLVVDEVSMIDLAMMHRLLGALPRHARLVLLGDQDQLPSVEAGNILADIGKYPAGYSPAFIELAQAALGVVAAPPGARHGLMDAVCHLTQSFRFSEERGIGRLSNRIRSGAPIDRGDDDQVSMRPLAELTAAAAVACYGDYLDLLQRDAGPAALLSAFDSVRILTPAREGGHGVTHLNDSIEASLVETGRIAAGQRFYHGRPILVTRNDYNLRLFNGDTGICIHRPGEKPVVVFRDAAGELRSHLASRLPPHETCFAMTVHKSQGSEFERVILVLPTAMSETARQLMTRELIYTAVTRARRQVTLYFDNDTLNEYLSRRSHRHSGLGERLSG